MSDVATVKQGLKGHLAVLRSIITALSRTLSEEQVAEVILHEALRGLGAQAGAVEWSGAGATPATLASLGPLEAVPASAQLRVPLTLDGPQPRGSLTLGFSGPRVLEEEERLLLEAIASLCAQTLERARLDRVTARQDSVQRLLAATVGHDLRNPLAAITTTVEVMRRIGTLDEQRQRCLEVIGSSSERLKRLLADVADLTVAAGPGMSLRPAPSHLDAVCRPLLRQLGPVHPGRELRYETSGEGLGRWDTVRLSQAVGNLVSNALRYGSPDTPVELRWDGTANERVWLEVENQAPDLTPDALRELFVPFRRERRASAEREGLGVGLFIAEHLVRAHGGSLQARSSGGVTVFRIELPREVREGLVAAAPAAC